MLVKFKYTLLTMFLLICGVGLVYPVSSSSDTWLKNYIKTTKQYIKAKKNADKTRKDIVEAKKLQEELSKLGKLVSEIRAELAGDTNALRSFERNVIMLTEQLKKETYYKGEYADTSGIDVDSLNLGWKNTIDEINTNTILFYNMIDDGLSGKRFDKSAAKKLIRDIKKLNGEMDGLFKELSREERRMLTQYVRTKSAALNKIMKRLRTRISSDGSKHKVVVEVWKEMYRY